MSTQSPSPARAVASPESVGRALATRQRGAVSIAGLPDQGQGIMSISNEAVAALVAAPDTGNTFAAGVAGLQPARRHAVGSLTDATPRISPLWSLGKRGFDVVGSLALLIVLSPVLAVLYALVARSGGSPIYGHRRIGRGGKCFTCYKFRTMVPNAEAVLQSVLSENPDMQAEWLRDEKLRMDPRVTRVGDFLRRSSLDELPQLLNVLRGDMSLVGPRPATDMGIAYYGKARRWYFAVRPGMTGLWQVSGRNEVGFRRRVVLDTYYVRAQSFLLDIQILFRTVKVVLRGNGY